MQDEVVNPVVQIVLDHFKEYYTQTASVSVTDNNYSISKCIYFIVFEYPMGVCISQYGGYKLKLKRRLRKKRELLNKLAIVGCTRIYDF